MPVINAKLLASNYPGSPVTTGIYPNPVHTANVLAKGRGFPEPLNWLDSGTHIASALGQRMAESRSGAPERARSAEAGVTQDGSATGRDSGASIAALMALVERFSYALASRDLGFDDDEMLDTLTRLVHRGFFGAGVNAG